MIYSSILRHPSVAPKLQPELPRNDASVTTLPGFTGQRLKFPSSIMPTAMTWTTGGLMAFTSLKGHVYLVGDADSDGIEDLFRVHEEGLAAPFGIMADGESLLVAHKPELIRLVDVRTATAKPTSGRSSPTAGATPTTIMTG